MAVAGCKVCDSGSSGDTVPTVCHRSSQSSSVSRESRQPEGSPVLDGTLKHAIILDKLSEVPTTKTDFIEDLADVLTYVARLAPGDVGITTEFHAVRAPSISISAYLERLQKFFSCSQECFVFCIAYIDRILKAHSYFVISEFNVHRLLATSLMVSAKFFDDFYYSNAYYAKVAGVRTSEMNLLERQFLNLIDWKLFMSPEEYTQYSTNVLKASESSKRKAPSNLFSSENPNMAPRLKCGSKGGNISSSASSTGWGSH